MGRTWSMQEYIKDVQLEQEGVQRQVLVNTIINFWIKQKVGNILTSLVTISISRKGLFSTEDLFTYY